MPVLIGGFGPPHLRCSLGSFTLVLFLILALRPYSSLLVVQPLGFPDYNLGQFLLVPQLSLLL